MTNSLSFRNEADKVFMLINENSYMVIKDREGETGESFNKETIDIEFSSNKKVSIYDKKMNVIKSNFSLREETEQVDTYSLNTEMDDFVSNL